MVILITTVSIILASDEGVILVCQQWPVSRSVCQMTPSPEASPIAPDVASRGDSPTRCADARPAAGVLRIPGVSAVGASRRAARVQCAIV